MDDYAKRPKPPDCRTCTYLDRRRVEPNGSRDAAVVLLGDYPTLTTPKAGRPFSDRKGVVLKTALSRLRDMYGKSKDGHGRWAKLPQYMTYAVQCVTDDKPPKGPVSCCRVHLQRSLLEIRPKVIVVFGAKAFEALGIGRVKFSDVRGTFQDYKVPCNGEMIPFKVFVTFSLDAVLAKPGVYDDLVRDLRTAFLFAEGRQATKVSEEDLIKDYIFPKTVEEIEEVCQHVIDYCHKGADPERHLIGADTETNMLEMYAEDAKMIAASFAWEPGKATAFLVDHPKASWTVEEKVRIRAATRAVFECKKPKVLHHEKFDRQVVELCYKWQLNNVVWDTMCGEHLIEEDKKGQYGLKVLTRTRLQRYAGYDGRVDEIRQEHGGLSRAGEAKRYAKAMLKYADALDAYKPVAEAYERALEEYDKGVAEWEVRRQAEKTLAKSEKRKMDKEAYGKKPKKPRKPKAPKVPEHIPPFDFTIIPVEDLVKYAAIDADVCRQHALHQNQRLNAEHARDKAKYEQMRAPAPPPVKRLMRQHAIPTSRTLSQMEFTGFPVDLDYLEKIDADLKKVANDTAKQLYDRAGNFVINNPKEVIAVLFQRGFEDPKTGKRVVVNVNDDLRRTRKGQIKADEKALLYVHKQYGYDFPKILLTHRKAQKARNPFLTNVREHAKLLDGRMHPSFHITGTSTGRLSSSGENMQNCGAKYMELLTSQGWVRFDALPRDVLVAQFDTTTGQITFVEPLEYIQRPCRPGELLHLQLEQIDLHVTRQHEQLVLRQRGHYAKVPAEDLKSGSLFVHAGQYVGGTRAVSPAWISFLCAVQADGCWLESKALSFAFFKKRKQQRLRNTLKALGVRFNEHKSKRKSARYGSEIKFYIPACEETRRAYTQLTRSKQWGPWLLEWTREALDYFVAEIMHWGGSYTRKNNYSSKHKNNVDWVQIVSLLSNRRARLRRYTTTANTINWQVDMPQTRNHSWTNNLRSTTLADYTDDVYCVRVPTGNIIVRHNGKAVITGNCPKKLGGFNIKNIFVPPDDMVLVNTDAKGAEIRLFAAYSNDTRLIKSILDGLDTHSFFVSQVWKGIKYEDVEKARELVDIWYDGDHSMGEAAFKEAEALVRRRTHCKRVVFGTLYGAMAAKIAETAGIPLEEAQEVVDLMFEMFPTIPAYIQSTQNEVLLYGGVYTKTGRKRRFPLANIKMFRNRCFRQAVNFKIQSTSSDIVLWVMNQIAPIIQQDLRGQLHATVHDSVVFSVPAGYLSQIPDLMHEYGTVRVAKQFSWLPIPFIWDIEAGPRYGQVINIDKYLEGHSDTTSKPKEDNDIVEGEEIREEINAELRV